MILDSRLPANNGQAKRPLFNATSPAHKNLYNLRSLDE
jgi:hypothetical protein